MNRFVQVKAADAHPGHQAAHPSVNIATSVDGNHQWPVCTQLNASQVAGTAPGEILLVKAEGLTGPAGSITNNGFKTIVILGYTGPA